MVTREPREVGIDHLTVVPENLTPDAPDGWDADGDDESGAAER